MIYKRLCSQAAKETREIVEQMCELVKVQCPEFREVLVPACEFNGRCHEMNGGCGRVGRS